jgi:hypothetical protein
LNFSAAYHLQSDGAVMNGISLCVKSLVYSLADSFRSSRRADYLAVWLCPLIEGAFAEVTAGFDVWYDGLVKLDEDVLEDA